MTAAVQSSGINGTNSMTPFSGTTSPCGTRLATEDMTTNKIFAVSFQWGTAAVTCDFKSYGATLTRLSA